MKIKYANENIKQQCTNIKVAAKLFGGIKN